MAIQTFLEGGRTHYGHRIDPLRARALFPAQWAEMINRTGLSDERLGYEFGVTAQTIRNWRSMHNKAIGHCVWIAQRKFPHEYAAAFGDAA